MEDITTISIKKRIIRDYYKQIYPHMFGKLDEMGQFLRNS